MNNDLPISWAYRALVHDLAEVVPAIREHDTSALGDILTLTFVPGSTPDHVAFPAALIVSWLANANLLDGFPDADLARVVRCINRTLLSVCRGCDPLFQRQALLCEERECPYCGATDGIETRGENPRGVRHICLECDATGGPSVFLTPLPEAP